MKKLILTLIITMLCFHDAQGQSTILEKINEIKSHNDEYYWNEYTHPIADTAIVNAYRRVIISISVHRLEGQEPTLEEMEPLMKHIKMNRGRLVRVFAYVKKSDVPGERTNETSLAAVPNTSEPPVQAVQQPSRFVPEAFVQKIMQISDFRKVYRFLKEQKSQGQLLQFGGLKEVEEFTSLDLILFDLNSQEMISMLGPENPLGKRINLTNGTEDSLDNYPEDMVAVIWYIK
jgi:hypothetical protein